MAPSTIRSEFGALPVMPLFIMLMVPPPAKVRTVPFFEIPPVRLRVPPPALIVALVAMLSAPANVLVPEFARAPPPLIPLPFSVNASALK